LHVGGGAVPANSAGIARAGGHRRFGSIDFYKKISILIVNRKFVQMLRFDKLCALTVKVEALTLPVNQIARGGVGRELRQQFFDGFLCGFAHNVLCFAQKLTKLKNFWWWQWEMVFLF
jgi:hypothetical protein